ncbi:hypothetical protein Tco_1121264 [Tanacetum coccineum]|uniref:Uncharacterized protein n=1 Tax=Tanacetum coccineum TaxID=301880 RepID=A0ABQ5IXE3_9ASTR
MFKATESEIKGNICSGNGVSDRKLVGAHNRAGNANAVGEAADAIEPKRMSSSLFGLRELYTFCLVETMATPFDAECKINQPVQT